MPDNRQIHLISRPPGIPSIENFKLHLGAMPEISDGEVLVKNLYLSVDPYMRGRLGGRPSAHPPFPLNEPASGDGVGIVIATKHADFQIGDQVSGFLDWAEYGAKPGSALRKFEHAQPVLELSLFGMPAMTAYFGLLDIGKPMAGETVVISGAAGAVGMVAGQIAKIQGCRVIGITGSDHKVDYLQKELGFDAAINYKRADWVEALKRAVPSGIDVYFDNVGDTITDEVMNWLNLRARIVLCGQIASYNLEQPNVGPRIFRHLMVKNAMAKGFFVNRDYPERFPEGRNQMIEWWRKGKIKSCETILDGIENLPQAFLDLFSGKNLGKQLVKI